MCSPDTIIFARRIDRGDFEIAVAAIEEGEIEERRRRQNAIEAEGDQQHCWQDRTEQRMRRHGNPPEGTTKNKKPLTSWEPIAVKMLRVVAAIPGAWRGQRHIS